VYPLSPSSCKLILILLSNEISLFSSSLSFCALFGSILESGSAFSVCVDVAGKVIFGN